MEAAKILELSMLAGEIMLSNGAETSRVEDVMRRIQGAYYGNRPPGHDTGTFVIPTGMFSTIQEPNGPVTMVRRVYVRTFHLGKVALVNDLSRNIVDGKITIHEAYERLLQIKDLSPYPLALQIPVTGIGCFSFCYMFGGGWPDCFCAFFIGLALSVITHVLRSRQVYGFLINMVGGCVISAMAGAFIHTGIGDSIDTIIIGSIMPLVPGIGLTNAVRDILEGDFLSGSSRILDAFMVAVSIAAGVGFVLKLWIHLTGGVF